MGMLVIILFVLFFRAPILADEKTRDFCKVCHGETVQDFLSHPHSQKDLDCDTCHGASVKHRSSQGHTEPDRIAAPHEVPALCGGCHPGKASSHDRGAVFLEQARSVGVGKGESTCSSLWNLSWRAQRATAAGDRGSVQTLPRSVTGKLLGDSCRNQVPGFLCQLPHAAPVCGQEIEPCRPILSLPVARER